MMSLGVVPVPVLPGLRSISSVLVFRCVWCHLTMNVVCCCRGKSARLRCGYKREYVNVEGDVDVLMTGPMLKGSTVFM